MIYLLIKAVLFFQLQCILICATVRCYQTGHSKHGVFNKLAFHTAGRTANIGSLNVDHFITNEDCIAVQFPVTKTNQVGSESATPAAPSYVHADGTTRAVPIAFELESVSVMIAWQRWNRGYKRSGVNHNESVRPFKDIELSDLKGNEFKMVRKRWLTGNLLCHGLKLSLIKKLQSTTVFMESKASMGANHHINCCFVDSRWEKTWFKSTWYCTYEQFGVNGVQEPS